MSDDIMRGIGRLEGKMDMVQEGVDGNTQAVSSLEKRVRQLELNSARTGARSGAASGGIVATGIALIAESLKNSVGIGGS